MRQLSLSIVLCGFVAGCGGTTRGNSPDTARPALDPAPSRVLAPEATFRDVVRVARGLHDRAAGDSEAGCLFDAREGELRLAADLAVAIRPLPEPPPDLDERLAQGEGVTALTRWGVRGDEGTLGLATFTNHPPPRGDGTAMFVTDDGVYLRSLVDRDAFEIGAVPVDAAIRAVASSGTVYVTAEGGASIETLHQLFARLSAAAPDTAVVLATVLAPSTSFPVEATPPSEANLCVDGLEASGDAAGNYDDPSAVMSALGPVQGRAAECMAQGRSAGGRLVVAFRVAADGSVTDVCAELDETGDPQLRACVLRAVESSSFPPPDIEGAVDLRLPLDLVAETTTAQAPVCAR